MIVKVLYNTLTFTKYRLWSAVLQSMIPNVKTIYKSIFNSFNLQGLCAVAITLLRQHFYIVLLPEVFLSCVL